MKAFENHKISGLNRLEDEGWKGVLPTMLFAIGGVLLLVVLSYRSPANSAGVGMVFPLSMTEDEILSRVGAAGGRVSRFGGFGHMAVVFRDDGGMPEADQFGAMFTVSPLVMSACFEADDRSDTF